MIFDGVNTNELWTVKENIMLPVLLDKKEQKECEEKAEALKSSLGLNIFRKRILLNCLAVSGRERQSAGRWINDPSIIFHRGADGNLRLKIRKVVMEEFRKINEEQGISF